MYIFSFSNSTAMRLYIGLYEDCLLLTSSIVCLLIFVFSNRSIARLGKKTSVYCSYFLKNFDGGFFYCKRASKEVRKG